MENRVAASNASQPVNFMALKKISSNNQGEVHLGVDFDTGVPTVAKIVRSKKQNKRELLILDQLNTREYKHFPKLFGTGTLQGESCFYLELLGSDIATLAPIGVPIDLPQVVSFGMQLVRRLEQLHAIGIIHNDLKLQNIVVGSGRENNIIKLIDFGLATSYVKDPLTWSEPKIQDSHIKTGNSMFEGNIAFASPDGLRNKKRSRKDDMMSVIYILIRLLTGYIPYTQECGSAEEIKYSKTHELPSKLCGRVCPIIKPFAKAIESLDF